jgi:hypothetical protein
MLLATGKYSQVSLLHPSPPFSDLITLFIQVGSTIRQFNKMCMSIPYPWRLVDAHLLSYNYKTCNHVIIHKRDNPHWWMDGWIMDRGAQQGQLTIINIMTSHKSNPHNPHYLLLLFYVIFWKKWYENSSNCLPLKYSVFLLLALKINME